MSIYPDTPPLWFLCQGQCGLTFQTSLIHEGPRGVGTVGSSPDNDTTGMPAREGVSYGAGLSQCLKSPNGLKGIRYLGFCLKGDY